MFLNIFCGLATSPAKEDDAMKLYYIETMNPRKACTTAKHLGMPVEYVRLEVGPRGTKSDAYRAINPNGTAPALVDGDRAIWESVAIAAHLATKAGSNLWPANDPVALNDVLRWISWDAFHWTRAIGPIYFETFVKPTLGFGSPDREAIARSVPNVEKHAPVLDAHLAKHEFVANDRLSIADFCLGAMLPQWQELAIPLEPYPNVQRWLDRLLAIEAFREPWPKDATTFDAAR